MLLKNDKKGLLDLKNKHFNLIKEQKNLDQDMLELTQKAKIYKFRIEEEKQKYDLENKVTEDELTLRQNQRKTVQFTGSSSSKQQGA